MAQPSTGPVGSGQKAVGPDSDDEGDHGSRIGDRARKTDCGPMPLFSFVDQAASRLPDPASILACRA